MARMKFVGNAPPKRLVAAFGGRDEADGRGICAASPTHNLRIMPPSGKDRACRISPRTSARIARFRESPWRIAACNIGTIWCIAAKFEIRNGFRKPSSRKNAYCQKLDCRYSCARCDANSAADLHAEPRSTVGFAPCPHAPAACPKPSAHRYAALVAAGEIERDPAQEARPACWRSSSRGSRAPAGAQILLARLAVRQRETAERADQGPLHLRRGRPRQDHADGSVFRGQRRRAQAPRAFPRIHGRRARARARLPAKTQTRRGQRRRSDPRRPPRSRKKPGCSASTNSMSPTSPMR